MEKLSPLPKVLILKSWQLLLDDIEHLYSDDEFKLVVRIHRYLIEFYQKRYSPNDWDLFEFLVNTNNCNCLCSTILILLILEHFGTFPGKIIAAYSEDH